MDNKKPFDIVEEFDMLTLFKQYLLEQSTKFSDYEEFEKNSMNYYEFKEKVESGEITEEKIQELESKYGKYCMRLKNS